MQRDTLQSRFTSTKLDARKKKLASACSGESEKKNKNKTANEENFKKKVPFLAAVVKFSSLEPELLKKVTEETGKIVFAVCGATRQTPSCDTSKQVITQFIVETLQFLVVVQV